MKSAIFKGIGQPLAIEDAADPRPERGQVVVKVGRCGICGTDLHMTSHHVFSFAPGSAIGHEYSGEVVELGKDVTRLKVGDRIAVMPVGSCGACEACLGGHPFACAQMSMMMGGFSEYTLAREATSFRLPATVSLAEGALVEPLAACLRAVTLARLERGARVLVLGAGAMGVGVAFWARRLGAGRIVVSARSPAREALALQMGADAYFVNDTRLAENAMRLLGDAPDVVFECTGAAGLIEQAIQLVRPRGLIVSAGGCMEPDRFVPAIAMFKEVRIQFAAAYTQADFEHAVDALERGAAEPQAMISGTIGLTQLPATFEALRRDNRECRIVVDPSR